jgi:hypothetical protein
MEVAIGRAIGTALGSNNLEQFILLKNISFTQKLNILGALCYVSRLSFDEREKAKLLTDIFNCYFRRNHVAHDQFVASKDTDGVEFIVIRAKREKVTMPSVDWSIADFESHFSEIVRFSSAIAELSKKLRRSLSSNALAELLAAPLPYAPTEGYTGLGSLGLLFPQPPAPQPLDRTPPTPETDPEIPPSPEK